MSEYACLDCGAEYDTADDMNAHIDIAHNEGYGDSEDRTDLCELCQVEDHEVCWVLNDPDPDCSCCRSTLIALDDE